MLVAASPAEAIALSDRQEGRIQLLLTDVVMPGMDGRELADRVRRSRSDIQVLYMSGYTANVVLEHRVSDDGGSAFLQKPITPDALARAVRRSLDAFRPSSRTEG